MKGADCPSGRCPLVGHRHRIALEHSLQGDCAVKSAVVFSTGAEVACGPQQGMGASPGRRSWTTRHAGNVPRALRAIAVMILVLSVLVAVSQWGICILGSSDDGLHCVGAILALLLTPAGILTAFPLRCWARLSGGSNS